MNCPECEVNMECVAHDHRQEWFSESYYCKECKKQFLRMVQFKIQSDEIQSDVLEEDYEVNNERMLEAIEENKKDNFYCENCFQQHLKEWLEDDTGSIFCSEECFDEFNKEVRNNKDYVIVEDNRRNK
jgi:hypothetical protein